MQMRRTGVGREHGERAQQLFHIRRAATSGRVERAARRQLVKELARLGRLQPRPLCTRTWTWSARMERSKQKFTLLGGF